jgi:tetratricopeptide (TPR) repeat protein
VRAFARARLAEVVPAERAALQQRWMAWCVDLARTVGFCWDDLDRLSLLDDEYVTLQAAISLAVTLGDNEATLALAEGVRYFYNVRGLWSDVELQNNMHRAAAARRLANKDSEVLALAHHGEILSKQGRLGEAAEAMEQLTLLAERSFRSRLARTTPEASEESLSDEAAFEYGHALGLYARAQGQLSAAETHWRMLLDLSERLGGQKYVVNRRWLATVLLEQGAIAKARHYFVASLEDARRIFDMRSVTGNALKLATIDMLQGRWEAAELGLAECHTVAARYRDRRRLAECHWLTAHICLQRNEGALAHEELMLALDLFERLGMRAEAAKVRDLVEK